ncbi:MAG: histidine phosphatase family protein, partial [Actinomycetota bacterium]
MIRFLIAALLLGASLVPALAAPARIIILRHGEKANPWKLCETGAERAEALAETYLGAKASKSLFADGERPAFFFAITLHTLELASPSVASWSKPIILYSVVPDESDDELHVKALNERTEEAAANIMQNPALNGKTVVMVWEHKHIANEKLEDKFAGEAVTLRKLLKLDILPGVPKTWP